jgi:hypothetical protein
LDWLTDWPDIITRAQCKITALKVHASSEDVGYKIEDRRLSNVNLKAHRSPGLGTVHAGLGRITVTSWDYRNIDVLRLYMTTTQKL